MTPLMSVLHPERTRDTHDEHGGVIHDEHLETGISGARECGDARGVAGMLTVAGTRAVDDAGCSG
jgi:hypothetical protein